MDSVGVISTLAVPAFQVDWARDDEDKTRHPKRIRKNVLKRYTRIVYPICCWFVKFKVSCGAGVATGGLFSRYVLNSKGPLLSGCRFRPTPPTRPTTARR